MKVQPIYPVYKTIFNLGKKRDNNYAPQKKKETEVKTNKGGLVDLVV